MSKAKHTLVSILLLVLGMLSIQFGATVAKQLFTFVSPNVVTMIRTSLAAVFLILTLRPWKGEMNAQAWRRVALYGMTLGVMNVLFYLALQRIPLGVAVALEFIGPLGVALLGSRRWLDIVWISLAVFGLYLLLPLGNFSSSLDPQGVMLALGAGVCWGLYIFFGHRVGAVTTMRQAAAWGMMFAAFVAFPFGWKGLDISVMTAEGLWWKAIMVAVLSSAIPYTLEMMVLKRMDSKTFGTLMSMEPTLAAMMGLIFLGEVLTGWQILAMVAIVSACVGATLTAPELPKTVSLDGVG